MTESLFTDIPEMLRIGCVNDLTEFFEEIIEVCASLVVSSFS